MKLQLSENKRKPINTEQFLKTKRNTSISSLFAFKGGTKKSIKAFDLNDDRLQIKKKE